MIKEVDKLKTINKIDVMSLAKMQAVITTALYLVVGIVMNLVRMVMPAVLPETATIPPGLLGIIGLAISGLIVGFITGALLAAVYNAVVPSVGGIKIELK